MILALGPTELHRVQIDVLSYSYPADSSDRHDRNWLRAEASVHVESFSASQPLSLLTWDLSRYLKELEKLHETLKGKAVFDTREDQLKLVLTGDGHGKIGLRGVRICRILLPQLRSFPPWSKLARGKCGYDAAELGDRLCEIGLIEGDTKCEGGCMWMRSGDVSAENGIPASVSMTLVEFKSEICPNEGSRFR